MGDGNLLPPMLAATHKPKSKSSFPQTYGACAEGKYLIDNDALLYAVTVSAYRLVRLIFLSLLGRPMR
jgi:hypothetical protein